jgi:hypothetical protein
MALAATLAVAPTSLFAEAQVQGSPEAVRIETQNSSIEEILAALGNAFELRYRSSANLAKQLSGTYQGSLQRVVVRVLEGYDFVLRNNKGKIEITVLGTRGAAPAAAVASNPVKVSPTAPAAPTTPAAAPSKAVEQPAPATPPAASASNPMKVAEGQIPGLIPATEPTVSKIPGMNIVSTPSDGQIRGLSPTDLNKIPGMNVVASPMPTAGLSPNSAQGQGAPEVGQAIPMPSTPGSPTPARQ